MNVQYTYLYAAAADTGNTVTVTGTVRIWLNRDLANVTGDVYALGVKR
ncbi:hypothetical protein [Ferviditalea candida]|uniref:Uncharacterized protein n=1 Tax=Ferviditalea candida TaxID=3108399 RepID=A0ABU5ZCH9_9BACL|nr:hypothetical protein [Paenibacillaceae bacterium T2]